MAKKPTRPEFIQGRPVSENRKARHEYFVEDTVEAGIILKGTEVKALRVGRVNIADSFAGERDGKMYVFNMHIGEWEGGNRNNHEPLRARELLLHKREIKKLLGLAKVQGYTLVPLKVYFNKRGIAKVLLGLAKGKKQYEKRESIKERDWKREQQRVMKRGD
ncbi:MAG: SsrA-binding protein SmpB [Alphaproteobacteria bacterium]|nr:SsrA-binding protein SmpB [Alphaproteobacteria bacterium]